MFLKTCLLLLAISAASADRVSFRPCANGGPVPLWLESDQCDETKCFLRRGQMWHARAAFVPEEDFSTLRISASAPFPIMWPGHGFDDGCQRLEDGAQCPITAGNQYIWDIVIPNELGNPSAKGVDFRIQLAEFTFPLADAKVVACAVVEADFL